MLLIFGLCLTCRSSAQAVDGDFPMATPSPVPSTSALLRLKQILGDRNAHPPIEPIVPVSKSSWWQGMRDGRYPQSIKLGPRTTVWRAADIAKLVETAGGVPAKEPGRG